MRQLEIISKNHIIMMIEKRQRILWYLNKQKNIWHVYLRRNDNNIKRETLSTDLTNNCDKTTLKNGKRGSVFRKL